MSRYCLMGSKIFDPDLDDLNTLDRVIIEILTKQPGLGSNAIFEEMKSVMGDKNKNKSPPSRAAFYNSLKGLRLLNFVERRLLDTFPPTTEYTLSSHMRMREDPKVRFLKIMKDYTVITMAPFCPVITCAHAVLRGKWAIVLPLNAYVSVGLKEIGGRGGKVEIELESSTKDRMAEISFDDMERVRRMTVSIACRLLNIEEELLPNYRVKLAIDIESSQGVGSSGALAVANIMALMASPALRELASIEIENTGSPKKNSEFYNLVYQGAFQLEEEIHGKDIIPPLNSPYSSGASVKCSLEADIGRLLEYRLTNWNALPKDYRSNPNAEVNSVCDKITVPMLLVLGKPKRTKDCLRRLSKLYELLGGDLDPSFFLFWEWITEEFKKALKMQDIKKLCQLLKIQNGLYNTLGIDSPEFTELIRSTSAASTGGSIIGGGISGTCLFISNDIKTLKQTLMSAQTGLKILDTAVLRAPEPAQLLRF